MPTPGPDQGAEADLTRPAAPRPDSRAEREARLAAALRANLRRRKAQARGREESATPPSREQPGEG
jgi:hypothetical protein